MIPEMVDLAVGCLQGTVRALLANSLYAAVAFALVAGFLAVTPAAGPRLRRALWLLVLVRLVLPPGLSHPFSLGSLAARWGGTVDRVLAPVAGLPHGADLEPTVAQPAVLDSPAAGLPWEVWVGGLWLLGGAIAVARWRRSVRPYRRLVRAAVPATDPRQTALAERWRVRLGVRRRVRLRVAEPAVTPFTLGVLRPVIVLPREVVERPAVLEPALAHEMAHVARADALWLGLETALGCLYFFHPLVRLTCSALDHERERCCDEHVLEAGGLTSRDYAGGLVEALGLGLVGAGANTFIPRKRRITMRVREILEPRRGRALPIPVVSLLVAVAAAVGLPMAGGTTAEPDAGAPAPDPPAAAAVATTVPAVGFGHPLPEGRLTMGWGPGRNPFTHEEFHHDGVDLAAPLGTPVVAPADGVVVKTVIDFGDAPRGRLVMLAHDGDIVTTYSHLEEVRVEPGQRVQRGDTIATVGSTGLSTGPHLHFEVRRIGEPTPLDPSTLVAGL